MCPYLKNMEGWKPKDLKSKSFANIQELFDKAMKRVNTFIDYRTELVEGSSENAEAEIAQESSSKRVGRILDEEQLAFLADPVISEAPVAQQTIPQNSAFQTEGLDAYDSDCDDLSSAKAVLMENLSSCDPGVLSEVPYSDSYLNDMINQDVQEMLYSEQTHIDDYPDNKINRDMIKLSIDNDQLLKQIMSQEIVHIAVNSVDSLDVKKSCVNDCNTYLELETELLKKKDLIEKDVYDKLLKSYSTLEKHCISLELTTQLNQEVFQEDNFRENQNAPTFNQLFELNKVKAQSQEKDTVIRKLKDMIKSLSEKDSVENVKKDIDEIETINIKLEHTLKNELRKLKGKNVVNTVVSKPSATLAPEMFKLDIEPISHRLKNNRDAYEVYLEKTIENTDTLRELVECSRKQNPSEPLLESTCMFTKNVQELLVYVSKTCPSLTKPCEKLVVVTPMNKDKKVSASGSKPSSNTKNNRITLPPSSNQKNNVEDHSRKVKSSLNKMKSVSEHNSNALVKHSVVQIVLWSLDSGCSKHMTGNRSQLINFVSKFLGTVRFGNDHIAKIMGYRDCKMGNVTISQVYYVERLGLPKLKYQKDHLCSACALGKSKKHSHKPKAEDSIHEKFYMLHMDLYGTMRIQSINGRKYILVIIDDYSRFTWVKFLRSKDEVPEFVIKFLKMIQVHLNATVPNNRTDNGTEFVNQTLKDYYEEVGIIHQTSVARTPR
ncbi:retrovirus-related pol polyprotein from transposon TNT 1-94 [Tanacetum coccineum]|uniref:Retrovirus-related pol polyprotein from transposon TNT 1-94 n=1 Tax=Tanacetum coccineum TaxID=301880 RepID=A0ABQ5FF69_9ASTR